MVTLCYVALADRGRPEEQIDYAVNLSRKSEIVQEAPTWTYVN